MDRCRTCPLFHDANSALIVLQVPDEHRFQNLYGHNPTIGSYFCLFTAHSSNCHVPILVEDKTINGRLSHYETGPY